MSTIVEILRETEVTLPVSLVQALEKALRRERQERQFQEEGLRAAMRAAAQASLARKTALRQEPGRQGSGRQEPSTPREPVHQEPTSGSHYPDSSLTNYGASGGRSEVRAVGRARPAKPIRSTKSAIVPEPDQVQSAPPVPPTLPHRT
jgi:hypothetical protein